MDRLCELCDQPLSLGAANICRPCYRDEAVRNRLRRMDDATLNREQRRLERHYLYCRRDEMPEMARELGLIREEQEMRTPLPESLPSSK